MALEHVPGAPWWHSTDVSIVPVPQHARRDSKNPAGSILYHHSPLPCQSKKEKSREESRASAVLLIVRTSVGGVVDEVEERLVDVEDDELEVRVPALHGVRGRAELSVEGKGVVVEALHAACVPAAEQGHGRREATHRRQRRHADPAATQTVQALHPF